MRTPTTLLLVTGLTLTAAAQLQNADFEEWLNPVTEQGMDNRPAAWRYMGFMGEETSMFIHPPSTAAANGNYALTMSVWYHFLKDMAFQEVAINTRPTTLRGSYTYTMNVLDENGVEVIDEALVRVLLTRWNTDTQLADTIGFGLSLLGESQAYTTFEVPINYTSNEHPDSIKVLLDPSRVNRDTAEYYTSIPSYCSFFTVDALELVEGSTGVDELKNNTSFTVYPNPAHDILFLPSTLDGRLFDAAGHEVSGFRRATTIDMSGLAPGLYTVRTTDGTMTRIVRH